MEIEGKRKRGGQRRPPELVRSANLFARVRPSWLAWLRELAARTGDRTPIEMIDRLVKQEAARIGHAEGPGR